MKRPPPSFNAAFHQDMADRLPRGKTSRRAFLIGSTGLLLPKLSWTQTPWKSMMCWKLDDAGDVATESNSGSADAIASRTGHATSVGAGRDRALRLDGYSVWITHQKAKLAMDGDSLTVAAWIALESYPVDEAAIVHLGFGSDAKIALSIDRLGFISGTRGLKSSPNASKSTNTIPKSTWHHLAATFDKSGITLYIDGRPCGSRSGGNWSVAAGTSADVILGKSPDCPIIAGVFPTGVVNGLLRDVRIFSGALSPSDLAHTMEESRPIALPDLQLNRAWCTDDPQRPLYHALPPRAWTNEPHGLIRWGGQYHLFYQKNPNGPYWGHINWGHMTSPDLHRWAEMPVALSPELGPDSEGCWSGSVIDYKGKLAIIYTGGDAHRASICLAFSDDGVRFTKHPGNPVILEPPQGQGFPEFRDPFVWREGETYYLIIGSAIKDKGGAALLYRSKDLINWEYRKPMLVGDRESSGVFWEMPIFVPIGSEHALIVCEVPGRASYWVGSWRNEVFTPRSACPQRLELFNHLLSPTPHILDDGRVITMGIIPDERSPKECWREGWAHLYSLPRVISTDGAGRIHQAVFEGIGHIMEPSITLSNIPMESGSMRPIHEAAGACLNVRAILTRGDSQSFTLRVRSSPDGREHTDIHYHWEIGRLVLDRSHSSLNSEVKKDTLESTYFPDKPDVIELDVHLDRSVLEVFVDQRSSFAARIYPTLDASVEISVGCDGPGAIMESVTVSQFKQPA